MTKRLRRFIERYILPNKLVNPMKPKIIPLAKHAMQQKQVSRNAMKVLKGLREAGYPAYLVGGCIRDFLVGRTPKDFDVVTTASPEQVRKVFRNCRLIGRRFRIAHVYFYKDIIEVSTFRAAIIEPKNTPSQKALGMRRVDNNNYGTIDEDVWRRDFTVNALYYDPKDNSIIDYTGGMTDLNRCIIRMIGDPTQRFYEDPIRLLRAIRLAAKLDFKIEASTRAALIKLPKLLKTVSVSRLADEVLKLFFTGNAAASYSRLVETGYFKVLFPLTSQSLSTLSNQPLDYSRFIELALRATDLRNQQQKTLNPAFLYAILLWPAVQACLAEELDHHDHWFAAFHAAINKTLTAQNSALLMTKRMSLTIREIWFIQYQLLRRRPNRLYRTLRQREFRAAYDFLVLRTEAGEPFAELVTWWGKFERVGDSKRQGMIQALRDKKS